MASRGEIWLINLNPVKKNNEVSKIRSALILQNDELNLGSYPTTVILPLSTALIDDAEPLRYRVSARDGLEKDSDILVAQIRSIDNARMIKKLAVLNIQEMIKVKALLLEVVG